MMQKTLRLSFLVFKLKTKQLGLNIENGEKPQVLVPKNYIFGSAMNNKGML